MSLGLLLRLWVRGFGGLGFGVGGSLTGFLPFCPCVVSQELLSSSEIARGESEVGSGPDRAGGGLRVEDGELGGEG